MSWNYSGDPRTSAKDAVRFYIQDTNKDEPLLQDDRLEPKLLVPTDRCNRRFVKRLPLQRGNDL